MRQESAPCGKHPRGSTKAAPALSLRQESHTEWEKVITGAQENRIYSQRGFLQSIIFSASYSALTPDSSGISGMKELKKQHSV